MQSQTQYTCNMLPLLKKCLFIYVILIDLLGLTERIETLIKQDIAIIIKEPTGLASVIVGILPQS